LIDKKCELTQNDNDEDLNESITKKKKSFALKLLGIKSKKKNSEMGITLTNISKPENIS
jgi:hypothetical protein